MVERPDWARDYGMYERLRDLVSAMARGKGGYHERLEPVILRFLQLSPMSFPESLRDDAKAIGAYVDRCVIEYPITTLLRMNLLTPKERDDFTARIMRLFESIVEDRGRIAERTPD